MLQEPPGGKMGTTAAIDWDDAYSNFAYIPDGFEYPAK
jgi:arylformamidase